MPESLFLVLGFDVRVEGLLTVLLQISVFALLRSWLPFPEEL